MADKKSEFSIREMEAIKARMAAAGMAQNSQNQQADESDQPFQVTPDSLTPPPMRSEDVRRRRGIDREPPHTPSSRYGGNGEMMQFQHIVRILCRHSFSILLFVLLFPICIYFVDKNLRDEIHAANLAVETQDEVDAILFSLDLTQSQPLGKIISPTKVSDLLKRKDFDLTLIATLRSKAETLLEEASQLAPPERKEVQAFIRRLKDLPAELTPETLFPADYYKYRGRIQVDSVYEKTTRVAVRGMFPAAHKVVAASLCEVFNDLGRLKLQEEINKFTAQTENSQALNFNDLNTYRSEANEIGLNLKEEDVPLAQSVERASGLRNSMWKANEELQELEDELNKLKLDNRWENLKSKFGIGEIADIKYVFIKGNSLREKWFELAAEQEALSTKYTSAHPHMQSLTKSIRNIQEQLRESGMVTSRQVVPMLPNELEAEILNKIQDLSDRAFLARQKVERLSSQLGLEDERTDQATKQVKQEKDPEEQEKIQQLLYRHQWLREREAALSKKSLDLEAILHNAAILGEQIQQVQLFALLSSSPPRLESPNLVFDIILAGILGLLLGVLVAFLLESTDNRLHTPFDIYYYLRLNHLGVVPFWKEEPRIIEPDKPDSHMAEIYAHMRNNIRYSTVGHPEKCLLVVSALQGEGKSTVAANLGISYSLEGNRVVLIDGDLRRPSGHKLFDIFHGEREMSVGLAEYLTGMSTFEDVTYETTVPGLSLIPAGGKTKNPAKLVGSERMGELITAAEAMFDVVIIDCPAVLPVVDATSFAQHVRGVLLVAAAEEVEVPAVRMALYRLTHVGSPIVGAVLNKVRERSTSYYYYGYHYRYRYGYQYAPYNNR
ncbi:MAG: CpsD/CapB family tyrosine-protein kinase [Planctomycetes bacterium]|nr:CpsD/CapB family tyrosine-protein kinase [Planctomycetota bacterium]